MRGGEGAGFAVEGRAGLVPSISWVEGAWWELRTEVRARVPAAAVRRVVPARMAIDLREEEVVGAAEALEKNGRQVGDLEMLLLLRVTDRQEILTDRSIIFIAGTGIIA